MKHRISMWASTGFLVACGWVVYTFVMPVDYLNASLREPVVESVLFASCPISLAGRYFPLSFWWIPPINAATYAAIGLLLEAFTRRKELGLIE